MAGRNVACLSAVPAYHVCNVFSITNSNVSGEKKLDAQSEAKGLYSVQGGEKPNEAK